MIDKQSIILGYFREGKSKKQLARELHLSPHTVRKYLSQHRREMAALGLKPLDLPPEGIIQPPRYNSAGRNTTVLTTEVCGLLEDYLEQNKIKRQSGRHKQQMKKRDMYEALNKAGHPIGYTTVCRYVRKLERKEREVFIRQHYEPGQAVEFDWGEVKIRIGGVIKRKMLAVFTSCYSNHRWAMLFNRQDMSSFLYSHVMYFAQVGGVSRQLVYDNMRTAVRKFTCRNKERVPTEELLKISCYYKFDYRFCNIGKGNEKGHVERSVEYVRRKAFALKDDFDCLETANEHLFEVCGELNQKPLSGKTQSIQSVFEEELDYLKAVPPMYDTGQLKALRVDKYSCVKVDTNWYSVPEGYVGGMLEVKIYPNQIFVYNPDHQHIATHIRAHSRFEYYLQIDHYLQTLRTKPGALAGSLSFLQADEQIRGIYHAYFSKQPKAFVELLLYLREKQYSIEQATQAIEKCIRICPHQAVSLDKIKILLQPKSEDKTSLPSTQDALSQDIQQHCSEQLLSIQSLIQKPV